MATGPTNRSARTEQLIEGPAQITCRRCGVVSAVEERYCESCGHDILSSDAWSVEVSADRAYHRRAGSDLPFPEGRMAAVLVFEADEITVGRRSESRSIAPNLDLSGELADPGVSHSHAIIRRDRASGLCALVDVGSTNGTTLNDDDQPIEPHQPEQLAAGDLIHIGAWTTIRISP